jgi:D-hexose-6-phosphate mutarotase
VCVCEYACKQAALDGSAPIRGGIPLIWPQFGQAGPFPPHGFVRTHPWTLVSILESEWSATANLSLQAPLPVRNRIRSACSGERISQNMLRV